MTTGTAGFQEGARCQLWPHPACQPAGRRSRGELPDPPMGWPGVLCRFDAW